MVMVDVHEAESDLSRLLQQVEEGEEVVICRAGKPVARLTHAAASLAAPAKRLTWGRDVGKFVVPPEFFEPLPDDILASFEGRAE